MALKQEGNRREGQAKETQDWLGMEACSRMTRVVRFNSLMDTVVTTAIVWLNLSP